MNLTGLFVWRQVTALGYFPLESYLSVEPLIDTAIICIDPTSNDETVPLAQAIAKKYPKTHIIEFVWPEYSPDGSAIGISSQFALDHVETEWVLNIQADETWPSPLMEWVKTNWQGIAQAGIPCMKFKILHLEHNAQEYQDSGNGDSTWETQTGAGYQIAEKMATREGIRFAHDGWRFEGCTGLFNVRYSLEWPIVHLHDHHRDHLIALRRNAADKLWTDPNKFGHYRAFADNLEATQQDWWNDPKWVAKTSPFMKVLHPLVQSILGQTTYKVRWNLLDQEK